MKRNIIKLIEFVAFTSILITSCVNDKDFEVPKLAVNNIEPNLKGLKKTTFNAVKAAYNQAVAGAEQTVTFKEDLYIEGYVISSDQAGNFYKELIIQNHPDASSSDENPRLGFRLPVNVTSLYQTYQFGRKVYVKLKGLSVGMRNGVLNIGKGNDLNQIQSYEYQDFILRSNEVVAVKPKIVKIADLEEVDENTYVQIDNVQFNRKQLNLTYAGEANDEFDGKRILESCDDSVTIFVETSTFADFKSLQVAQNKGTIKAIFTRDFRDDLNVLKVNTAADIIFDDDNRCDPISLDCGLVESEGEKVLFADNFEDQSNKEPISGNGWVNYSQQGTRKFMAFKSNGVNASKGISVSIGSYKSGDSSTISWLISPQIDLDANTKVTLSFETSNSFADGSNLELLFSNDWDGSQEGVLKATWGVVNAAYLVQNTDDYKSWFKSGFIDLSCGSGKVYFAFKYTGSGNADFDGSYEMDNFKVTSKL